MLDKIHKPYRRVPID